MKHLRSRFILPCLVTLLLTSCVVPGGPLEVILPYSGNSYGTYTRLPPNYVGNTYYYGGRYYWGGRYESGAYYHRGRPYGGRYFYNGRYYYGGRHEYVGGPVTRQSRYYNNQYRPHVRRYQKY